MRTLGIFRWTAHISRLHVNEGVKSFSQTMTIILRPKETKLGV